MGFSGQHFKMVHFREFTGCPHGVVRTLPFHSQGWVWSLVGELRFSQAIWRIQKKKSITGYAQFTTIKKKSSTSFQNKCSEDNKQGAVVDGAWQVSALGDQGGSLRAQPRSGWSQLHSRGDEHSRRGDSKSKDSREGSPREQKEVHAARPCWVPREGKSIGHWGPCSPWDTAIVFCMGLHRKFSWVDTWESS